MSTQVQISCRPLYEHTREISLPRFGRYLPRCTARLMTPKVGTAFNILLESYPCSACDKMRLGDLRFLMETGLTKAQGRPDSAAAEVSHIGKAREDLFLRRWSRSLRRWPRTSFATLPALDQKRDAAALCKLRETAATCVASLTSRHRQIWTWCLPDTRARTSPPISALASARSTPSRGNEEEDGSRSLPAPIRTRLLPPGPQDRARCRVWLPGDDEQMSTFRGCSCQGRRLR